VSVCDGVGVLLSPVARVEAVDGALHAAGELGRTRASTAVVVVSSQSSVASARRRQCR